MKITAIICAYNSAHFIERTLLSLSRQTLPSYQYEILVVDNNSKDKTAQVSQEFIATHHDVTIRYTLEEKPGLSHARNKGIAEAEGTFVVFIDDDAEANQEFLEQHVAVYEQYPEVIAVGGKVVAVYPDDHEPEWMSKYISGIYSVCHLGNEVMPFHRKYPVGCNMSFRKTAIQSIGGFNTNIRYRSDEKYVFGKLKGKKDLIYYTPYAIAYHHVPSERMTHDAIKKIAYVVGAGERERLQRKVGQQFFKLLEYIFKLAASAILAIKFLLQGSVLKAKYIWLIRYYILIGFFIHRN